MPTKGKLSCSTYCKISKSESLPLVGICFGIQSLNVFRGGSLVQDIPALVNAAENIQALDTEANADQRQTFLLDVLQDLKIGGIAVWIKLAEIGMRDGPVVFRVDVGRAAGKKNPVDATDVLADDFAIASCGYH